MWCGCFGRKTVETLIFRSNLLWRDLLPPCLSISCNRGVISGAKSSGQDCNQQEHPVRWAFPTLKACANLWYQMFWPGKKSQLKIKFQSVYSSYHYWVILPFNCQFIIYFSNQQLEWMRVSSIRSKNGYPVKIKHNSLRAVKMVAVAQETHSSVWLFCSSQFHSCSGEVFTVF